MTDIERLRTFYSGKDLDAKISWLAAGFYFDRGRWAFRLSDSGSSLQTPRMSQKWGKKCQYEILATIQKSENPVLSRYAIKFDRGREKFPICFNLGGFDDELPHIWVNLK